MKKVNVTTAIMAMALVSLTAMSCKNNEKKASTTENQSTEKVAENDQNSNFPPVIKNYLTLKNALANDDNDKAKKAGKMLMQSIENFDVEKYASKKAEVNDILADAKENAEHISESPLHHQREHFKILSKDMEDLVAITGTPAKLYQEFCPMYDDGKGGSWLSTSKDVKNPYYGKKMQTCGEVQKTINP